MQINYENIFKYYVKKHLPRAFAYRENIKKKRYGKRVRERIDEAIAHYEEYGKWPLFGTIEIETINRCNSTCSFCPVNRNVDTREYRKMEFDVFQRILHSLKDAAYHGSIGIYSNNEPFLDERICQFAKIAKEIVPDNQLYLYTNGTLLNLEKFQAIMQYLDKMYIDNYNDELKLIKPVKEIHQFCKAHPEYEDKVRIRLRKLHDVLFTRGGQAPNRKDECIESLPFGCMLPFRQMVVRPDGKVSLCCNDALGKMTLGDLTQQSIEEVWNSEQYTAIRYALRDGRKDATFLCTGCDSLL